MLIPKGFDAGDDKSVELVEKLCYILGFTSRKEYEDEYRKLKHRKKNKERLD